MSNRYYHRSKEVLRRLVRLFALDLTASDAARLSGVSVRSVNDIYLRLRERLPYECERRRPFKGGEVSVDESYFGPRRVRGKRGRGAGGKTSVFGIFERGGRVYSEVVPDCSKRTLSAVIRGKVKPHVVIHSDGWRGYDGLVDVGHEKHLRVHHGRNQFARGNRHINGIGSFWGYAKRRPAKCNGVSGDTFYFHPKEIEYRFNLRRGDLYGTLLKMLRREPL
ncbi:MAG: transposase-like protein [Phycisphaerales bacterium]|nr:transposase-like protein [Phycisphaerales bacterium]